MIIGDKIFDTKNKTYIMGILNVTEDSFYDGSKYNNLDRALFRCEEMLEQGAHIIDVGAESTRPGAVKISAQKEMELALPVIEAIKSNFDTVISLDTYKAATAKEGIKAGASLINDIGGLKFDEDMASVIGESGCSVCIMHNEDIRQSDDMMGKVLEGLQTSLKTALAAHISKECIMLDPGIGFGKGTEGDYKILSELERLKSLNYPILIGLSRKSLIGNVTDTLPMERLPGTLALNAVSILKGASFIRVHDVKEHAQVVKVMSCMVK